MISAQCEIHKRSLHMSPTDHHYIFFFQANVVQTVQNNTNDKMKYLFIWVVVIMCPYILFQPELSKMPDFIIISLLLPVTLAEKLVQLCFQKWKKNSDFLWIIGLSNRKLSVSSNYAKSVTDPATKKLLFRRWIFFSLGVRIKLTWVLII